MCAARSLDDEWRIWNVVTARALSDDKREEVWDEVVKRRG